MLRKITNTYRTLADADLVVVLECNHKINFSMLKLLDHKEFKPNLKIINCIECDKILDDPIEAYRLACFGRE